MIGYACGDNTLINLYSNSKIKGKDKVGKIIGGFRENFESKLNYKDLISESTIEGETNVGDLWGYINEKVTLNKLD